MENFPSGELLAENREKELKKKRWDKLRTLALAGSLLANGGFMADQAHQKMQVHNLNLGRAQAFSVDFGGGSEDNLDPRGKWGEHAELSLQKGAEGQWLLVVTISAKEGPGEKNNTYTPVHSIHYELPASLSPMEAEAIFNHLEASAKKDANDLGAFEAALNQTVDLSKKGDVIYYNPATGKPKEKVEFSTDNEEVIQTNYFNREVDERNDPKILSRYRISLQEFQSEHINPEDNYEEPEQRERMWHK